MNSDTRLTVEEIAKEVGAVVPCQGCGNYDIYADDPDADGMAYARATNYWNDQDRAFRGMTREEVMRVVKAVLSSASYDCPSCANPN